MDNMRGWTYLTLMLALCLVVPVAADEASGTMPSAAATTSSSMMLSQGTFVGHADAVGTMPETVTIRHEWEGMPLIATYVVRSEDRWLSQGQPVVWGDIQEGASITVPSGARLMDLTFGGPVGVGTVTAIDRTANTVSVRLPSGERRTLRYASGGVFLRDGQALPLSQLAVNDTVLFEVPPDRNHVALFTGVGVGTQATITEIGDRELTVRFMENGQTVTRTFSMDEDTRFFTEGRQILAENFPAGLQSGQTVWFYGETDNPRLIVANPTMGFETAMIEQPTVITATPSETTTTTIVSTMAPPFDRGEFVSHTPATDDMPAMVTMRFNWNGTPLLATFAVQDESRWMYQGQQVNFAQLPEGTMLNVPGTERLANLTFGGTVGVATINSIDRTANTITVRLPSGELRTLRVSPQAIVLREGQPMMLSELSVGDSVLFEVPPQRNMVALFMPVDPGVPATVTQVTDDQVMVRASVDGELRTFTYAIDDVRFYHRGVALADESVSTMLQEGQTVYIFGPVDEPQFVASGVQMGFETAVIEQPVPAVAGVRETPEPSPAPTPRVIRGRW